MNHFQENQKENFEEKNFKPDAFSEKQYFEKLQACNFIGI